jgi:hypothetical protein
MLHRGIAEKIKERNMFAVAMETAKGLKTPDHERGAANQGRVLTMGRISPPARKPIGFAGVDAALDGRTTWLFLEPAWDRDLDIIYLVAEAGSKQVWLDHAAACPHWSVVGELLSVD